MSKILIAIFLLISIFSVQSLYANSSVNNSIDSQTKGDTEYINQTVNYNDYSGIYTEFELGTYICNQEIIIDFNILTQNQEEFKISIMADGAELLSDKNFITIGKEFTLIFTLTELNKVGSIDILAKYKEIEYAFKIYFLSYESTCFVNIFSPSISREMLFNYLESNNILDVDSYNEIVLEGAYEEEINRNKDKTKNLLYNSSELVFDEYITINGNISYAEDGGTTPYYPDGVKIKIYDDDGLFDTLLATTKTNRYGDFSYILENDTSVAENGYDIFIKVVLENDDFEIQKPYTFGTYSYTSTTTTDAYGTLEINEFFSGTTDFGRAFQVHQDNYIGFKHLDYLDSNRSTSFLNTVFPYSYGCWYDPVANDSYINLDYYESQRTVLHEFGHYVADMYSFTDFIARPDHSFIMNETDEYGKDDGPELAWSEGWAHYYSAMVLGLTSFLGQNIEYPNPNITKGEACEYSITSLLYAFTDYYDPLDPDDEFNWGEINLFEFLQTISDLDTLSDFVYKYLSLGYDYEPLGKLLTNFSVSSDLTYPTNNATLSYELPTFSWSSEGGSISLPNNEFVLKIIDQNGTEYLTSPVIENNTAYTVGNSVWMDILNSGEEGLYWYITAYETSNPESGPYPSETYYFYLPEPIAMEVGDIDCKYIGYGGYYWYEIEITQTGLYTFYTTGTTDTYGEVFFAVVPGQNVAGVFLWNNDSGTEDNFEIKKWMYKGEIVYLRVRGNYWSMTGTYYFHVSYSPSSC